MTVGIVTDSSCDLRGPEVAELGIEIVPLTIRFGDDEFVDREELSVEEFYRRMAASDRLPETAAAAPGRFVQAFKRRLDDGCDAVVCVTLSGGVSATIQSARTAAEIEGDIHIVDSRSLTAGLGTMVLAAAAMAADGASAGAITDAVTEMRDRSRLYGALDTLENLKKGGRIGGAQAMLGSMLSIKPLIKLQDGEVAEAGRQRTRRKALAWLCDTLRADGPVEKLAVMHGEAADLDSFLEMLEPVVDPEAVRVEKIGPVVGAHAGPGVMGITYLTAA